MVTISLCMIVKNEEDTLLRCLDSVREAVDEIIVVDTGSTDGTKKIAQQAGALVYDFAWCDDFAAARNEAFSKAKMDYCMWLDADDIFTEPDKQELIALKATLNPRTDVVMMKYNVAFDAQGTPSFSYYRERLLKNRAGFFWEGEVHEVVTPRGEIVYSDIAVTHKKEKEGESGRNLRIYEGMIKKGKALGARQQFYYARELYDNGRREEAKTAFLAFLAMPGAWVENKIEACRYLSFCHRAQEDTQGATLALLQSFLYAAPRAEICCDLGQILLDEGRNREAAFWYETALTRPRDDKTGGFVLPDCYDYLPALQLCVCYDRLGERERARVYNERAASVKPQCPAVRYNRAYFERLDSEK